MEQQLSRLKQRSQKVSPVLRVLHTLTASVLAARILLGCARNLGRWLGLVGGPMCVCSRAGRSRWSQPSTRRRQTQRQERSLTRLPRRSNGRLLRRTAGGVMSISPHCLLTGQAGVGEHAHDPCSTRSTLQVSKQRLTLWIALLSPI